MKFKTLMLMVITGVVLSTISSGVQAAPPAQTELEGEEYIVQADDWLSKLAEKFYGDALAYPFIVEATNSKVATDDSFTLIENPDVIEIGQKLWVPTQLETSQAVVEIYSDVAGIYKGFSSAASSPGIDSTIYLNVDQTFKRIDNYLNGESPITEVGTWELNEAGQIVATITGQENRDYDTPQTLTLIPQDEQLTPPEDDTAYNMTWVRLDALATTRQHLPYDPFTANQEIKTNGFGGIYKGFAPSASCCGQDFTLTLNPTDNTAQLETNFHNGEPAIVEVGTWESTRKDRMTLTLTGQKERTDDTPQLISLVLVDGLLVIESSPAGLASDGLAFYHTFAVHIAQALKGGGDEAITYYLERSLKQTPDAVNLWAVELIKTRLQTLLGKQYVPFIQNMTTTGVVSKEDSVFYVLGQGETGQAIFLLDEASNSIEVKLLSDKDMAEYTEGGQEIQNLPTEVTRAIANWQSTHGQ